MLFHLVATQNNEKGYLVSSAVSLGQIKCPITYTKYLNKSLRKVLKTELR